MISMACLIECTGQGLTLPVDVRKSIVSGRASRRCCYANKPEVVEPFLGMEDLLDKRFLIVHDYGLVLDEGFDEG